MTDRAQALLLDRALDLAEVDSGNDLAWRAAVDAICRAAVRYADSLRAEQYADALRRSLSNPCSVPGCPDPVRAGGLCETHYRRQRRGIPLDAPLRRRVMRRLPAVNAEAA